MGKINNEKHNAYLVIEEYKKTLVPQADSLSKIAIAIEVMKHSPINEKDLSSGFSMDKRQANYYADAMRFINIIDSFEYNNETIICLSKKALIFFKEARGKAVETKLAQWLINNGEIELFKKRLNEDLSEVTQKRRMQSLKAWEKFINERIKYEKI